MRILLNSNKKKHLMPGQNKTYCQDESGNYGKTIWQYRWPSVCMGAIKYIRICQLEIDHQIESPKTVWLFCKGKLIKIDIS